MDHIQVMLGEFTANLYEFLSNAFQSNIMRFQSSFNAIKTAFDINNIGFKNLEFSLHSRKTTLYKYRELFNRSRESLKGYRRSYHEPTLSRRPGMVKLGIMVIRRWSR